MPPNRRSPDSNAAERKDGHTNSSAEYYWRSQPNDARESWAFLALGVTPPAADSGLAGWCLATGNPVQIVRTYSSSSDTELGSDVGALFTQLDVLRRNEATLFTPTRQTLRCLRTHLLADSPPETPTLRGFSHVPLADVVDTHFANSETLSIPIDRLRNRPHSGTPSEDIVEKCWELRTEIGDLVPIDAIQGTPL